LAAAVRATLAASPGRFAAVAYHQATQAAVVALYSELSRALPVTRSRIAAASARGAEVVRLVADVKQRLVGFFDEDELAQAAAARLATDPAAAARLGALVWYLPDRLTPAMTGLVRVALEHARPAATVISLTGEAPADQAVLDTARRAGVDLGALPEPPGVAVPTADRLVGASDADEEVRQVVREVIRLVADGTRLDRIAIFRPTPGSYGRTLIEQLDGAGIPHNGPAVARLADTLAGRTLRAALTLRTSGWGRSEVIALVTEAPVEVEDGPASLRRWDALSRRAGVVGGLDDWRSKLDQLGQVLAATLAELESGDPASGPPRIDIARRDLQATRQLAGFIDGLASAVADVDHAATWARRAAATRGLVTFLLGPEPDRRGWPELEAAAAQQVDEALDRLADLDDIDPNPSSATFELAVAAELDVTVGRLGRFGHGVLVAPLASAVGLDLDAVFVVGMAEGTCPAFGRDDALLPDVDRERAEAGELVTRDERLRAQHRSFLAALAAGAAHRTLSFPRGDLRARRERRASRWLLASASELAGRRIFSSDVAALDVLHTVASYGDGLTHADHHGSVVERDVAALQAVRLAGAELLSHPLVSGDLARGFAARTARSGPRFTEWDGNLAGQPVPSPARGRPMSSTRLETWASCPFRYFLGNVLHLGERDDPERVVEISPADKGTLIHKVLEGFLTEVIDRGAPNPD
ncbi:MAG TPA: PD-(D/E)XK nuclease family protein, partial [Acidimicrobiales bacterium]|nr:PD-(D/E)XK nuclease family protein [Acidimicrobiales bacterium]